eukprot:TRINITY_DN5895_c0_g1_i2.p1 TRINITY_DN5895_c0_g1~~TRINITY_DN5895_c0_g1_i2.p1  ORF type:complete len:400 (+),score=79.99 TRINITY_DN5895_c0_g1_i2:169-1368(+)
MLPYATDILPHRLASIVEDTLKTESEKEKAEKNGGLIIDHPIREDLMMTSVDIDRCLDIEAEEKTGLPPTEFPNYTTRFITTHKDGCRCARFSPDGKLVATGSIDTSIKLIDVDKMKNYNASKTESSSEEYAQARPVMRTFYDHALPVNDIDFHPHSPILISCSKDATIKFYDYSKPTVKKAFRYLQDTHPLRSVHFHPSGDYIAAASDHHMIRIYDVNTFQAYTGADSTQNHVSAINQVRFAKEGNIFASCSKDGSIKLWDTVSFKLINTIPNAHTGYEVSSVQFSHNGKYLLSGGKDSTVRLWELSTGHQLRAYTGCTQVKNRLQTIFNWNEDFVISSDEGSASSVVWDTRTGEQVQRLTGHNNIIRWISASPVENAVITCSDDHRARFWVASPEKV